MSQIQFFQEDIEFQLDHTRNSIEWLTKVAAIEDHSLSEISYIFCSDDYLLEINREFLNHDYYTDIVTFDHSEEEGVLMGDIFISIDRVRDNAQELDNSFKDELDRVMVHGMLHLIGYSDSSEDEKILMRQKEDTFLSLRSN